MIRPMVNALDAALSPFERASEIIFGILMAISVTAATEILEVGEPDVGELAIAALGCNLAWGLIDGVIFLMHQQFERFQRHRTVLELRALKDDAAFRERVRAEVPPVVGAALTPDAYAALRRFVDGYGARRPDFWTAQELAGALGIAVLVFLSTLPLVIPFVLMEDAWTALRFSHGVAIVMLFVLGWRVGKWAGASPGWSGTGMALVGALLAVACVALGG
jgi:hypothetical protein